MEEEIALSYDDDLTVDDGYDGARRFFLDIKYAVLFSAEQWTKWARDDLERTTSVGGYTAGVTMLEPFTKPYRFANHEMRAWLDLGHRRLAVVQEPSPSMMSAGSLPGYTYWESIPPTDEERVVLALLFRGS